MESTFDSSFNSIGGSEQKPNGFSTQSQDITADEDQASTGLLCQYCLEYDLVPRIAQFSHEFATPTPTPTGHSYACGSIEEIRSRKSCPFCILVCRLIPPDLPSATQINIRPRSGHLTDRRLDIYTEMQFERSIEIFYTDSNMKEGTFWPKLEPARISGYIHRCERDHDHSRLSNNRLYHRPIDITLIDVIESRLVRGSSRDRYFALSYVWGAVSIFQTTTSNRASLEEPGSLLKVMKEIPRIIQDSMTLILSMGERYLWVDSLCIEQDNKSQKYSQISQMDSIYSQAVATIVALSSLNAASGLPGVRSNTLLPYVSYENIYEIGRRIEARAPPILEYISKAHYESRAWTFQERLLSKRCLLFTNTGPYFHCSEGLIHVHDGKLLFPEASFNALPDCLLRPDPLSSWASAFAGYVWLVRHYTKRHLSYPSDTLNAFSGLLELFRHRFGGDMIAGLPSGLFDMALLWAPLDDRRYPIRNPQFPSWSWAGWIGPVEYWPPPDYLSPAFSNDSHNSQYTIYHPKILLRKLESAITHFYLPNRTPRQEIRRDLPNMAQSDSNISDILESKKYPSEDGIRRETLEFDALAINVTTLRLKQVQFSRRYHSRKYSNGVCGAMISADRNLEDFEQDSTDLVLLSRFSPLSLGDDYDFLKKFDFDWMYFDAKVFEIREWCLLNLMIIAWNAEKDCAERVGLCVLHEDVWTGLNPQLKHVILS